MPIRFHCEACEARVKVPSGSQGRKVKCPRCGQLQRVPTSVEEPVTVGPAGFNSPSEAGDSGSFEAQPQEENSQSSSRMQVDEPAVVNKGGLDAGDSLCDLARSIEKDMTPPHEPAAEERLVADEPSELESVEEEANESASNESLFGDHFESQDQDDDESYEYEEEEAADSDESQEEADYEQEEQEEVEDEQPEPTVVVAAPRAAVTPPRAIPLTGPSEASETEQAPAEERLEVQAAPVVVATPQPAPETVAAPAMIKPKPVAASEPEQEEAYEEQYEEDDIEEAEPYLALRNLATALRIFPALLIPVVLWYILAATTMPGAIVTLVGGGAVVAMTWTLAEIADAVRDIAMR